jgi:fumarylacetoacetate (FAA) hydrolase
VRLVTFRDPHDDVRVGRLEDDRVIVLHASSMVEWLRGEGHEAAAREHPLADVRLCAPVPRPPSLRDFFSFERHVGAGWRLRGAEIPEAWYEAPAFYFSNPASIHGPGRAVRRPRGVQLLDFELEMAAIIGADQQIAGFTLLNDWSARDVQAREMTVGLGPAKGKDFATSLGPWLATPDELPYVDGRLQMQATVTVNGRRVTRADAAEQHWTWPQIVAHAARDTELLPGDVLGSGTLNGGCLLELGPLEGDRFLVPGDVVALEADGLGRLETPIV